jgi:hypothetical protein
MLDVGSKQVVTANESQKSLRAFQEFQPTEKAQALLWAHLDHQASQEGKKTSVVNSENECKMR